MTVISTSFFVESQISPFHSGSESYSELNPTEPQVKFPSEEVRMKLSVAGWGQQEVRIASMMLICCYGNSNLIEDQSCSSIQQASCSFTPEVSPFSCSGRESFSGLNQSKQQRDQVHSDDSRIKPIMTNLKRQEQNRNALKDKNVECFWSLVVGNIGICAKFNYG
ncbi:hypothetical protein Patl1_12162 [Pistacia atlantica]|uniref:Uncharacterized protein n=1 Tax=Pistacia atlantica TaxID=434234 RepID=A0ACC1A1P9_9ROSI|nr:hypothetical protein Patl1_12162 [Pistacia atlantica]